MMRDHEMERYIRTAVEHAAPDKLDSILSSCDEIKSTSTTPISSQAEGGQRKGAVIKMSEKKRRKTGLAAIAAVAAAFVLCFGGYSLLSRNRQPQVDSIVMLDVNPSLSLYVDAAEKVISAEALNDDARDILGTMDLKDTSLEVAVNAIIGSMLQKGYLDDLQNSILVSVENSDAAKSQEIEQKVSQAIASAVQTDSSTGVEAAVLSQTVSADDTALQSLAEQYGISLGKAALIQEVIAQDATLTFDSLATMSINEIALIASSKHMASDTVTQTGTASDKAYISREDALAAACAHAGVAQADLSYSQVEFDSEDGLMVYEVDFRTGTTEYEYDINAVTGEVIKFEREDHGSYQQGGTSQGNTGGQTTDPSAFIGEDAAIQAALTHAGVAQADTVYVNAYVEYDDGRAEYYEVDFAVGNTHYEYEIDLYTGAVLKNSTEQRGGQSQPQSTQPAATQAATQAATEAATQAPTQAATQAPAQPATQASSGNYIGESAALSAALTHAGVSESQISRQKVELDRDDGRMIYEVEFHVDRMEYDYEIDAETGSVLKAESDWDD